MQEDKIGAIITIKQLDEDHIEILGQKYYREQYLNEMMRREYQRGLKKGITIHAVENMPINEIEKQLDKSLIAKKNNYGI